MTYATFMVHCDLEPGSENRLKVAASLAERFDARLIGIAAHSEALPLYFDFAQGSTAAVVQAEARAGIERRLKVAEERFRAAMEGRVKHVEWRAAIDEPLSFVMRESRAADLLIAGKNPEDVLLDPANLVMLAGRPVLLVARGIEVLRAERILIAWKDTREARRAVVDALPLLTRCQKAIVAEIDEHKDLDAANRRVADVASWLEHHGVNAASWSEPLRKGAASQIEELAEEEVTDLIVAGAYGHGKFRERILGGATRTFLRQMTRCHLLSH